ncbi:MAG TPA: sigma-70 family RNA polymerase sigma factor [Pseudonocardiaceae bacterium]|nr:sigma-70 family RNA polymerase sigma factor [Pseudonocardiaceae bacterium]
MSVQKKAAGTRRGAGGHEDADLVRYYLTDIGSTPLLTAPEEVVLAKRIEAGVYAAELLRQANAGEITVSAERRRDLSLVARDGARAKDHMIRANLRLVVSLAKKQYRSGLPFLDIVQEGNLGLIRAVEKFDYAKGYKFSTYATWWIRQAIGRGLAEQSRTIRVPVHIIEELARYSRMERKLAVTLQRDPTIEELAAEAGTAVEKIVELRRAAREAISLDAPVGEEGEASVGDLIQDSDGPIAADLMEQNEVGEELRALVNTLAPREALIISMRYGLYDGHQRTLQEVADHIGLTRERIRQLEKLALAELRDPGRNQQLLALAS